ncbi:AbrB/MazE/SpoVT family DNA-binding domain-containing protein [Sporolactobacillus vineae]|uniref:AbrB/MazE/SpoVT family DNA-binding domain-containing protein n=1 Tax=Sporolactobacillus vineae TaxID=444463 RepID=UPI000288573D|nr:AbrB/MazE/SpoVT family DNA-binding domain-containing protein [Sporolactobacillus vineae]
MTTKVQKWGNSLAVRIPKTIAETAGIYKGTELVLSVQDETIVLKPQKKDPSLKELLSEVTSENRHDEAITGKEGEELL